MEAGTVSDQQSAFDTVQHATHYYYYYYYYYYHCCCCCCCGCCGWHVHQSVTLCTLPVRPTCRRGTSRESTDEAVQFNRACTVPLLLLGPPSLLTLSQLLFLQRILQAPNCATETSVCGLCTSQITNTHQCHGVGHAVWLTAVR